MYKPFDIVVASTAVCSFTCLFFSPESAVVITPTVASPTKDTTIRPSCTVTGEAFVGWYGPDGRKIGLVGRKYVETKGNIYTLVIKDVNAKDGGTYECHGNASAATLEVDVPCK